MNSFFKLSNCLFFVLLTFSSIQSITQTGLYTYNEEYFIQDEKTGPNISPKTKMEFGQHILNITRKIIFTTSRVQPALLASLKRAATTSIYTRIINGTSYIPPLLSMTLLLNMILTSYTIHTKFQTITICCKK